MPPASRDIIESTLAGAWYSGDPARLRAELDGYLAAADAPADRSLLGVVMPHAGYAYSGACAAFGARTIALRGNVRRVVLLGFSHRHALPRRASVPSHETAFRTPLGDIPLDTAALARLLEHPAFCDVSATRHGENSIEMQLPILQAALGDAPWSLVPVALGQLDDASRGDIAQALEALLDDSTVWVASSDFTHYGDSFGYVPFRRDIPENLRKLDHGAIDRILAGDAAGFLDYCDRTGATICGQEPIAILLRLLPPDFRAAELHYDTSGRATGSFDHSVSYATIAFYKE